MTSTENGCAICQTFVSGLRSVYDTIKQGEIPDNGYQFQWTFEDHTPSLPGLADSAARGCSWCAILDEAVTHAVRQYYNSHQVLDDESNIVNVTINCHRTRQIAGPLGDIGKLTLCGFDRKLFYTPKYLTSAHDIHVFNHEGFLTSWMNNLEVIRDALDNCVDQHQSCPGPQVKASPLRLINVMDGGVIKLEEPGDENRIYTALSYCWGESRIDTTRRINVKARMNPFPLNTLPPTLQDAILFTRHLQIQYIWIDAICIVQDCTTEWTEEAQKMMEYYAHARLTVVPIVSTSADCGMSLGYNSKCRKFSGPWSASFGSDLILSSVPPTREDSIFDSRWNKRGWTYQERLNSSRILFVLRDKLVLACREGSFDTSTKWERSENTWMDFLPTSNPITDRDFRDLREDWFTIVQFYSMRTLTKPKDRWFAFIGIAKAFQDASRRRIVVGLWEHKIIEDIVSWAATPSLDHWHTPPFHLLNFTSSGSTYDSPTCSNCKLSKCAENLGKSDSSKLSLPSWTWLSTDDSNMQRAGRLTISRVELTQEPSSKLLQVIEDDLDIGSCKLSISGAMLPKDEFLGLMASCYDRELVCPGRGIKTMFLDKAYDEVKECSCHKKHHENDRTSYHTICSLSPAVSALLVGPGYFPEWAVQEIIWHFVLIQPNNESSGRFEPSLLEYRRVGTMHIPENGLSDATRQRLNSWQREEITLV
ncbi:heterokaryon incompatibility protein-domain-containing protein [Annulohypoxylon stygium]|nr:heterokaryon incompatibility protein-domain-containing protein [Annulohypoxylon stygium]